MEHGADSGQEKRFWRQQHERSGRDDSYRGTSGHGGRDDSYHGVSGRSGRDDSYRGTSGRGGRDDSYRGASGRGGRDDSYRGASGRGGRDDSYRGTSGRGGRDDSYRGASGRGGRDDSYRGASGRGCDDPYRGREERGEQPNERGIEIVYGRHPVNELMHSGRPVQRLHVLANAQGIPKDIFTLARERAIPVVHTDRERLDYLCNHANHQGVVAEAGGGQFAEASEVMERPLLAGECPFFLVLDGVQDPGNFGAILRSAEAAGVHGVFMAGDGSCGLTGTVSKASAGADQYIPVARVPKLSGLLRVFRENGYVVAGTEVEGSVPYTDVDYTKPTVIVMGAEEAGLRPSVREQCTDLVRLPMRGKVQSLNVSAATAVILYEVVRQR